MHTFAYFCILSCTFAHFRVFSRTFAYFCVLLHILPTFAYFRLVLRIFAHFLCFWHTLPYYLSFWHTFSTFDTIYCTFFSFAHFLACSWGLNIECVSIQQPTILTQIRFSICNWTNLILPLFQFLFMPFYFKKNLYICI